MNEKHARVRTLRRLHRLGCLSCLAMLACAAPVNAEESNHGMQCALACEREYVAGLPMPVTLHITPEDERTLSIPGLYSWVCPLDLVLEAVGPGNEYEYSFALKYSNQKRDGMSHPERGRESIQYAYFERLIPNRQHEFVMDLSHLVLRRRAVGGNAQSEIVGIEEIEPGEYRLMPRIAEFRVAQHEPDQATFIIRTPSAVEKQLIVNVRTLQDPDETYSLWLTYMLHIDALHEQVEMDKITACGRRQLAYCDLYARLARSESPVRDMHIDNGDIQSLPDACQLDFNWIRYEIAVAADDDATVATIRTAILNQCPSAVLRLDHYNREHFVKKIQSLRNTMQDAQGGG
jgi:hypothetical protein